MTRNLGFRAEQFSAKRLALHLLPRQPWLSGFARWREWRWASWQAEMREGSSSKRPTGSFRSRFAGPRLTWRMTIGSVVGVNRCLRE